jgi:hypothetical protein
MGRFEQRLTRLEQRMGTKPGPRKHDELITAFQGCESLRF